MENSKDPDQDTLADESLPTGEVHAEGGGIDTRASVNEDGRININVNLKRRFSRSSILLADLQSDVQDQYRIQTPAPERAWIPPSLIPDHPHKRPPSLNVVIQVVGSRGDVQPFVALGKVLKEQWNHRVRIATHAVFKKFVEENGLEFFSIGGDPAKLMAFMVKHPGLLPNIDALFSAEVRERRRDTYEMLEGCWKSCFVADDDLCTSNRPFVADCIIANPPSFGHIHCAEKLNIPLHIMFTMPWSSTTAFPHPLANIQSTNSTELGIVNLLSYPLVETLVWQGLGDVINKFRRKLLNLSPIHLAFGPRILGALRVPHTSPSLIPKPNDWKSHLQVAGFYFLPQASSFTPNRELELFLAAGPRPVYIGFGSIVVDDPDALTKLIFRAAIMSGQRALVNKGWGGIGADSLPDGVMLIDNVPHDWLFPRVSCVVHHGGAGTTAAGIACGTPTVIVPFFGDQPFWGNRIAKAGAGPKPIPKSQLTAENLSEAILFALQPSVQERARELKESIDREDGTKMGAASFHEMLGADEMRCVLIPERTAAWKHKRKRWRLSAFAASLLLSKQLIKASDLKLLRHRIYDTEWYPTEPISGALAASLDVVADTGKGVFMDTPKSIYKAVKTQRRQNEAEAAATLPAGHALTGPGSDEKAAQGPPRSYTAPLPHISITGPPLSRNSTFGDTSSLGSLPPPGYSELESPHDFQGPFELEGSYAQPSELQGSEIRPASSNSSSSSVFREITEEDFKALQSMVETTETASASASASSTPATEQSGSLWGGEAQQISSVQTSATSATSSSKASLSTGAAYAGAVLNGASAGMAKGVGRVLVSGVATSFEILLQTGRGFHNLPLLYGDKSARPHERVTGTFSGIGAAGKGLGLAVFDSMYGLVALPVKGAMEEGGVGFVKGFAHGVGGLAFKPTAAMINTVSLPYRGMVKDMQSMGGLRAKEQVALARMAQGADELERAPEEERARAVERWLELTKKKRRFPFLPKRKQVEKNESREERKDGSEMKTAHPLAI
ncbi:UDP-Glycosyltransferase/glycogen phosphorylase [Eremomyces bilateralis CBS 781.70]|uniref:UDP-Glycosyltransferase/glycogen phosphorylase n=1 Tax=Eremomyces bilateralis CBS 781.70 TaxID=1392243 RepID=A0A6G1GF22_9PEZI|nr:UDP-Glycosyltransferase/glycogen phosphorylase [Eremomyces bilateralis CBS 781.70]KAF1816516.1 UDP-Glycosyltransferase/glycogen phosphorylase [Eremomyces bilateralis CBS 781.70]